MRNTKEERKAKKLAEKDEKYLKKYGVTYSKVTQSIPKPKKGEPGYITRFLSYYKPYIGLFLIIVLLTIAMLVGSYFVAYFTQNATDQVIWRYAIISITSLAVLLIANYIISYFTSLIWIYIKAKSVEQMRKDMAVRVVNTTSGGYRKLSTGEVVTRVTSEPTMLSNNLSGLWDSFDMLMTNCTFLIYFYVMNVYLGLFMTGIVLVDFMLLKFYLKANKPIMRRGKILNDIHTGYVTEFVRGNDDIKGLNLKPNIEEKNNQLSKFRYNHHYYGSITRSTYSVSRGVTREILLFGMLLLGVYFIYLGELSLGAISIMLMYRNSPANLSRSITNIAEFLQERMNELFSEDKYPQEKFGKSELKHYSGEIRFKKVSFKYEDEIVLDNISFEVPAGKSLGIVGKSGEGKSTILSLINRLNDCESGQILLDDIDNRELTEEALRTNVCLVPQTPYIFNTTIRENLLYAKPDATEEELKTALQKAQIYDFIMSKPEGLDIMVGEGGIVLSGGQRQRLALARAFLKDSKLILLDEATSALDNKNQEDVKKVIAQMKDKCTFIIVAHRLSTIVDCDEIIVLDNHKIIAKGKHDELMETCPQYSDLYKLEKQITSE